MEQKRKVKAGPTHQEGAKERKRRNRDSGKAENDGDEDDICDLPPEMIELILSYLDPWKLQRCRLVCKSWNKEACRLLKGKLVTPLKTPLDFSKFSGLREKAVELSIPNTLQEMKVEFSNRNAVQIKQALIRHSSLLPSVTHLTVIQDGDVSNSALDSCGWIVQKCAPSLTHLIFADKQIKDMDFVLGCLPTLDFPSLEVLRIPMKTDGREDRLNLYRDVLLHLSRKSPYLHTLDVTCTKDLNPAEIVIPPEEQSTFEKLLHLHLVIPSFLFHDFLTFDQVPRIKSLVLTHGSTLSFTRAPDITTHYSICRFLNRIAPTLELLKLDYNLFSPKYGPTEEGEEDNFPDLPSLKTLQVGEAKLELGEKRLLKTPALQRLEVGTLDLSKIPNLREQIAVLDNLEKISMWSIKVPDTQQEKTLAMITLNRVLPHARNWRVMSCYDSTYEPLIDFVASELGQSLGFIIEELTLNPGKPFPSACVKGLKRLKIIVKDYNPIAKDDNLINRKLLPDLQRLSYVCS